MGYGLLTAAVASVALPLPAAAQDEDKLPPEIHVPADIVTDATSAAGAQVFFVVTATNDFAPDFLECTGPSGAVLPLGRHSVTCIATDVSGRLAQASFNITVNPGAATVALTSATNLVLASTLGKATQQDLVALLNAIAAPPSASRKCDKMDETKDRPDLTNGKLGNRDSCLEKDVAKAQRAFTDYVRDAGKSKKGTAPTIPPAFGDALIAAAGSVANTTIVGAMNTPPVLALAGNVTTKLPPADWVQSGATSVLYTGPCSPPSGTQFPVGVTTITCTANTTGGTTTMTFTVTVNPR